MGCGCVVVVYCHGCRRLCCAGHHIPVEPVLDFPADAVDAVKARLAARPGARQACPPWMRLRDALQEVADRVGPPDLR